MRNEIDMAHEFLWQMLEEDERFAHAVPDNKRIRNTSFYIPQMLDNTGVADTPRVMIVITGYQPHLDRGSNLTTADVQFSMMVQVCGRNTSIISEVLCAWMRALLVARRKAVDTGFIYNVTPAPVEIKVERVAGEIALVSLGTVAVSVGLATNLLLGGD